MNLPGPTPQSPRRAVGVRVCKSAAGDRTWAHVVSRVAPLLASAGLCGVLVAGCSRAEDNPSARGGSREPAGAHRVPGAVYWNDRKPEVPWSIHIVKVDRRSDLSFISTHARNTIFGLGTLGSQIRSVPASLGKPVVGINGDFYVVDNGPYVGDPRGLQIMNGEVVSAPTDQVAFWVDPSGAPHAAHVESHFTVTLPDGTALPLKLNEQRGVRDAVLYTPRLGPSTRAEGGREFVLEQKGDGPALPLEISQSYSLRVSEVSDSGDTPLRPGIVVLSFGPRVTAAASLAVGSIVKVSTATDPAIPGTRTAIGGGNILISKGAVQEFSMPVSGAYKFRSVVERHPRSAVGFNDTHVFLVEVDGRQPGLSIGMTLHELGLYMKGLGCEEAMNFDGGGSSTLWFDGRVVNSPCNGGERDIGNGLVVVRKPTAQSAAP